MILPPSLFWPVNLCFLTLFMQLGGMAVLPTAHTPFTAYCTCMDLSRSIQCVYYAMPMHGMLTVFENI
jgi:hypothetical protein